MYTDVTIRNFRGFHEFQVKDLGLVNILTGRNGTGKTALLEALFLLTGGDNSTLVLNLATMRGLMGAPIKLSNLSSQLWETLFHDLDSQEPIELFGTWAAGKRRTRQTVRLSLAYQSSELIRGGDQLDLQSAGLDSTAPEEAYLQWEHQQSGRMKFRARIFIDENGLRIDPRPRKAFSQGFYLATRFRLSPQADADRLGNLELRGDVEGFLDALRIVEPEVRRVTTVSRGGVPVVHADIGLKTLLPLALLGDGVSRLASLMLGIADCRNGVALIDEVENGFHYSTHEAVWKAILATAGHYQAQLVVSSHSLECVRAAARPLSEGEHDVRLIRLERKPEGPVGHVFGQEQVLAALQSDVEIR